MILPRSSANIPPALPFIHKLANRVICNIGCCCYIFAMTVGLDSTRDEEGLSGCLVCPCHRAAALTPAERTAASVSLQRFTLPSLYRSGSALVPLNPAPNPVVTAMAGFAGCRRPHAPGGLPQRQPLSDTRLRSLDVHQSLARSAARTSQDALTL